MAAWLVRAGGHGEHETLALESWDRSHRVLDAARQRAKVGA